MCLFFVLNRYPVFHVNRLGVREKAGRKDVGFSGLCRERSGANVIREV